MFQRFRGEFRDATALSYLQIDDAPNGDHGIRGASRYGLCESDKRRSVAGIVGVGYYLKGSRLA